MNKKARRLLNDSNAVTKFSGVDREILRTSVKCEEISFMLQEAVSGLKRTDGNISTMWTSFREALKGVWNEERINTLKQQLDRYRKDINS